VVVGNSSKSTWPRGDVSVSRGLYLRPADCPGQFHARLAVPTQTGLADEAQRLGYRSQRETPHDRSFSRAFTLREKIGGKGGIGDYIGKPKGMHWRTFEQAKERVDDAEKIVLGHSVRWLD
jgi:hypothetical protein